MKRKGNNMFIVDQEKNVCWSYIWMLYACKNKNGFDARLNDERITMKKLFLLAALLVVYLYLCLVIYYYIIKWVYPICLVVLFSKSVLLPFSWFHTFFFFLIRLIIQSMCTYYRCDTVTFRTQSGKKKW